MARIPLSELDELILEYDSDGVGIPDEGEEIKHEEPKKSFKFDWLHIIILLFLFTVTVVCYQELANFIETYKAESVSIRSDLSLLLDYYPDSDKPLSLHYSLEQLQEMKASTSDEKAIINLLLGYYYSKDENYEGALKCYQTALENDKGIIPNAMRARIYYDLSHTYLKLDQLNESSTMFNVIKKMYNRLGPFDYYITLTHYRAKDLINAGVNLQECADLLNYAISYAEAMSNNKVPLLNLDLGKTYWRLQQYAKSTAYMSQAILTADASNQDYIVFYGSISLGTALSQLTNYQEAIQYFQKALNVKDNVPKTKDDLNALVNIYTRLIQCYSYFENADDMYPVLEHMNSLRNVYPNTDKLNILLSYLYSLYLNKTGDPENAFTMLKHCENLYQNLISKDTALSDNTAIDIFSLYFDDYVKSNLIEAFELDLAIKELYGEIYYNLGRYDKAIECHKKLYDDLQVPIDMAKDTKHMINAHAQYLGWNPGDYKLLIPLVSHLLYIDYLAAGDYASASKYAAEEIALTRTLQQHLESDIHSLSLHSFNTEVEAAKLLVSDHNKYLLGTFVAIVSFLIILFLGITFYFMKNQIKLGQLNNKLTNQANTDGETGMPNKKAFLEFLDENLQLYIDHQMPLGIFLIRIKGLEYFSARTGKVKTKDALAVMADCIMQSCRYTNGDFCARLDKDHFILLIRNATPDVVRLIAKRILEIVKSNEMVYEYSKTIGTLRPQMGITITDPEFRYSINEYILQAKATLEECMAKNESYCIYKDLDEKAIKRAAFSSYRKLLMSAPKEQIKHYSFYDELDNTTPKRRHYIPKPRKRL